jgi:hypothetical protein
MATILKQMTELVCKNCKHSIGKRQGDYYVLPGVVRFRIRKSKELICERCDYRQLFPVNRKKELGVEV